MSPAVVAFGHTVRAVPTTALLTIGALAAAPPMVTLARGGHDFGFALVAAAVVGGAGFAYAIDDDASVVLAPSPTTLFRRRAVRLGAAVLAVGLGWQTGLAAVGAAGAFDRLPLRHLSVEACTAAGLGVAVAAVAHRRSFDRGGLAGVTFSVLALLTVTAMSQQYPWLPRLGDPAHHDRWLYVAAGAWVTAGWASRDPARRRPRSLLG